MDLVFKAIGLLSIIGVIVGLIAAVGGWFYLQSAVQAAVPQAVQKEMERNGIEQTKKVITDAERDIIDKRAKIISWVKEVDSGAIAPAGVVVAFAGAAQPPKGWLICKGQAVKRSDFPALYATIGDLYGSAGPDEFRLPDYRGTFLRGLDDGRGLDRDLTARNAPSEVSKQHGYLGSLQSFATALPNKPFVTDIAGKHSHPGGSLVRMTGNGTPSGLDGGGREIDCTAVFSIGDAGDHNVAAAMAPSTSPLGS